MKWAVVYTHEALEDLKQLDGSQKKQVLKAIDKVSENPLPNNEGGYGKPLGNHLASKLVGYLKIKLSKMGLRVIYQVEKREGIMRIVIISLRDDETVYTLAQKRIQ